MNDDLTAFLVARLDELEAAAKKDRDAPEGALRYSDTDEWGEPLAWLMTSDRVLREVEAKRALILRYKNAAAAPAASASYVRGVDTGYKEACLDAIEDAAALWDDHPDYRPEWKP